ncbi:MAG: glycosyltransferase [Smithella sp.]|nr:glycosyltransferase [Smithella sp.]
MWDITEIGSLEREAKYALNNNYIINILMNILVLTPVYPNIGNEIEGLFNEQHALALKKKGVNLTVIICKPWLPKSIAKRIPRYKDLALLQEKETRHGIDVYSARYIHVPQYHFLTLTIYSCAFAILQIIKKHLNDISFDLIQVHSTWPVGMAAVLVARRLKCPLVVTMHIEDDAELYTRKNAQIHYQRMISESAAIIAVGTPLVSFIEKLNGNGTPRRIERIPNGVDHAMIQQMMKMFHPCKESGKMKFISVCNLWRIKGVDLNLRALARLNDRGIHDWHYTVVGDGPERIRLEELARDLGIKDRVEFTGRLLNKDAIRKVMEADVFTLPSRNESFGVVYLEAMACGKPVVACLGTGSEDIVINGETGLLVPQDNVAGLADALMYFTTAGSRVAKMGEAGRRRSLEFTWDVTADRYLSIYKKLIQPILE